MDAEPGNATMTSCTVTKHCRSNVVEHMGPGHFVPGGRSDRLLAERRAARESPLPGFPLCPEQTENYAGHERG